MGGNTRAALRREKRRKQKTSTSSNSADAATHSRRFKKCQQKTVYDSDSDSSGIGNRAAAIPLPSLEDANDVIDFSQQLETHQTAVSKRARAEMEQHAVVMRKKRFREEKAEKIVWRKFDRDNRDFEQFYERWLGLEKHEFKRFLAVLKKPIPVYLRINGNHTNLSEIVTGSLELDFNLKKVTVPTPVGGGELHVHFEPEVWASEKRLWKLSVDSKVFRKVEGLRSLSTYVRVQESLGTLLRQDPAVTILSAFLDVQPGQRVLDLCGGGDHRAPVLNEYLCPTQFGTAGVEDGVSAQNFLVVNVRDATAAALAVQKLTRTLPRARELVVTVHKPEEFPTPRNADALFDRVICCASCSGDGLIRKIPEKWRTWSPEQALLYHPRQLGLADHAVTLVRVGGTLLYSTRSLNPIENEAVVAELLRRANGALELVNTDKILQGLQRSHGLTQWTVLNLDSWEDAPEDQRHRFRPSMWPPSSRECAEMHLEHCVRVLPHHNDTHGLFLAVIRKVREVDVETIMAGPALKPQSMSKTEANAKKKNKQVKNEKPFGSFALIDRHHLASIQSFYGLYSTSAFLERAGMARQKRAVHVVTPAVAELVTNQFRRRLNIYHAGVFALKPGSGVDAVADELTDNGARALLPEMKARILILPQDEFISFMEAHEMWLKNAGKHAREQLAKMTEGSFVVMLDDMEPAQTRDRDIVLVAVKRHNSCSIISSPAAIARVKLLLGEVIDADDGEDGYDSLEFGDK